MSIWDEINDDYKEYINKDFERVDPNTSCLDIKIIGSEPEIFVNKWNREQYRIEVKKVKAMMREYNAGKSGKKQVLEMDSIFGSVKWLAGGKKLFSMLKTAIDKNIFVLRIYRTGSGFDTRYSYDKIDESKQSKIVK